MKLFELETLLENVIFEEINKDQLTSTAQSMGIDPESLRVWLDDTDPTPRKSFAFWLLRALKKGELQPEDDERAKTALNRFIQLRNARKIEDIMQFPNLHTLETRLEQLAGEGAKRQGFAGINPVNLPGVTWLADGPGNMKFYNVRNADSLAQIGEGTKWCTRKSFPNCQAWNYLNRFGSLIVGYKDGKPYIQMNPDYSQANDVNDVNIIDSPTFDKSIFKNLPKPDVDMPETWNSNDTDIKALINWSKLTGNKVTDLPMPSILHHRTSNRTFQELVLKSSDPSSIKWAVKQIYDDLATWSKVTGNPVTFPKPEIRPPDVWNVNDPRQVILTTFAEITGEKVDLPMPRMIKGYKQNFSGEPKRVKDLKDWMKLTGNEVSLPKPSNTQDEFIHRLANAISKGRGFFNLGKLMGVFVTLAKEKHERIPEIEDVILKKDFDKEVTSRRMGNGGEFKHYAGMYEIVDYVKYVIKGNWPEFEKKIDSDFFNAMYYYLKTGLKPINSTNDLIKETFALNAEIQSAIRSNSKPSPELRERVKNYLVSAKKTLKYGETSFVIAMVLKPYTNKLEPLASLMGNKSYTRSKDVKMVE